MMPKRRRSRPTPAPTAGSVDLDDAIFGIEPNVPVMHQVVTAQLAARRPARRAPRPGPRSAAAAPSPGSRRAPAAPARARSARPHWVGGGVALGPKPRDYAQRTPKKMIRLALRSALSDRAADGKVVVRRRGASTPRAPRAPSPRWPPSGSRAGCSWCCARDDEAAWKSFRNLHHVHIFDAGELNAYDVLVNDYVVFTQDTLPVDRPVARGSHAAEEAS